MVALYAACDGCIFMDTQPFDVIIIGAGAAGLMCAIEAGKRGRSVVVLDKADKPGRKILISGGGRCNFTNLFASPDHFLSGNRHFCKSALSRYTQWDFIAFMDDADIGWHEKTRGQLFCDDKAPAVVNMLLEHCEEASVDIRCQHDITAIKHAGHFEVTTTQGTFHAASLVIATGGPSIPRMGSSDFGIQIARQFGLHSIPFKPALVPFTFDQQLLDALIRELSGLATDAVVSCNDHRFHEGILFTHRGLSGPAMLQISSYWNKGDSINIDLLPGEDAMAWLQQEKQQSPRKTLTGVINAKLPKRLAEKLAQFHHWPNGHLADLSDKALGAVAENLTNWRLTPSGTEGMRTAEVCLGGVDTDELSSKTLESKKVKGLYFIGETVDVTGHLGGYNFQWAWASGWCAGQYV